jgi:cytochrome c556
MEIVSVRARHASPLRIFCLSAAIWLLGSHSVSFAQNEAVPPAKDTIFARKILMGTVDMNMDEVETMLAPGGKLDVTDAREHLNTISVLLMAFPHLFPAATNQWKAGADRDPALDTFASPELWSNFAEFYRRASEASKIAFEASRTTRLNEFKTLVGQLRAACNSCHARFLKTE